MYDGLFPDATRSALNDRIAHPLTEWRDPPGIFGNFWGAVSGAVVAAPVETMRALTTIGEAYGKYAAPQNRGALSVIDPETLKRMDTHQDVDIQAPMREIVKRYTPDPATTGVASQIIFGGGKVLGKALGYGAAGGFPGAVIGTAADEGINETLRLTDQGVDVGTAAKVGAIHGVATGVGVAAPIAGRTILQTAGIVAATGPGLYIAENAAARAILKAEDYGKVAEQYNPLDPVGLAASAIPGAGIGTAAHVLRRARAGRVVPTTDEVAAARGVLGAEQIQSASLASPADVGAANAHVDAVEAAGRALDAGEPISVAMDVAVDPGRLGAVATRMREALTPEVVAAAKQAETELDRARGTPNVTEAPAPTVASIEAQPAPRLIPTGEFDEKGNPLMRPLADELAQADLDIHDARAFDVAVRCFLGGS